MPMEHWDTILARLGQFAKEHREDSDEKQQAATFLDGFAACFGLKIVHEEPLKDPASASTKFIDGLFPGKLLIEMKSRGKNLSDAYLQAQAYCALLGEAAPRYLLCCDFEHWHFFDRQSGRPKKFLLRELPKRGHLFRFLLDEDLDPDWGEQQELTIKAAEKMARLCDALEATGYDPADLPLLLTRLLFCVFAEDTGIFDHDAFKTYVNRTPYARLGEALSHLFTLLDADDTRRDRLPWLSARDRERFRYINGGLFRGAIQPPDFDFETCQRLLGLCDHDWRSVSPAIFGSLFQGVTDPKRRHDFGAHYTSETNILALIRPLFLDALRADLAAAVTPAQLDALHARLAALTFLDPACGCGNFLIVAYRELRRLELDLLRKRHPNPAFAPPLAELLKVRVTQFYGLEIEPFPAQIAQTGLWLTDHLANLDASAAFNQPYDRLPLRDSPHIQQVNALKTEWPVTDYIMGNPPFLGASNMTKEQKAEAVALFGKVRLSNSIDYVGAWYRKALDLMNAHKERRIDAAFVSTNSITQGEQVAALWKPLYADGIKILWGVPTFKWSNEAKHNAAVHCVIIGFSNVGENRLTPYLTEGKEPIIVESRSKPLCPDVPTILLGNKPADDGNLILSSPDEVEPLAQSFVHKYVGAVEFLHNTHRYCLWLKDMPPAVLMKCPKVLKRVEAVRQFRLKSTSSATRATANAPSLFFFISQPETGNYILMPGTSSERREYIPIGFLSADVIASNSSSIIPNATLYHFGVLTSSVHNAWMRAVCGRLEMRYRYSNATVYNTFPWPEADEALRAAVEEKAQAILDARAQFPDSSLADLYNPLAMPPALRKAHTALDRLLLKAYALPADTPEPDIVRTLLARYAALATTKA
ncbi:MAG: DNA methyltransferase [Candidatus Spyradenecus sp.]